jgi:hypothetical protein
MADKVGPTKGKEIVLNTAFGYFKWEQKNAVVSM